jgi:DNA-binding MarR family transcriptional regulator
MFADASSTVSCVAVRERRLTELELGAWRALLRAHSSVTRLLGAELEAECGLSLPAYDVLIQLAEAPDRRLRMTELAERVLLSRSGLTRLVDRLAADGYLSRETCPTDARGTFAVLTSAGLAKLRDCSDVHLRGVREHVTGKLTAADQRALASVLGKLAGPEPRSMSACAG